MREEKNKHEKGLVLQGWTRIAKTVSKLQKGGGGPERVSNPSSSRAIIMHAIKRVDKLRQYVH